MTYAPHDHARASLLLAVLAIGCPGDKVDTASSTSGTDAPTTTASPTEATATDTAPTTSGAEACDPLPTTTSDCCCFTLEEDSGFLRNDCPEMPLCGALDFTCSLSDGECPVPETSGGTPAEFTVDDMAALTCVLEALRDGEVGLVTWSFRDAESSGAFSSTVSHHVQADRRVFAIRTERADLTYTIADTTEETLKDAAYFTGCLQAADVRAMALCLNAATTGEVVQVCEPGGSFEDSL
jgi:hypothetical protein